MKYKKGTRKPKSKRGHNENKTGRYRSRWVDGECLIVPIKSSLPTAKLKESAEVMRGVFPESNELLSHTVLPSPKGVKEAVEELRPKAEVVAIGRNRETRSEASPVIQSDAQIIANLEAVINKGTSATNEESAFVGPPKAKQDTSAWMPKHEGKLATVHGITGGEATRKATPPVVSEQADDKAWVKLHGTCIIDTGEGMTPSGKPITDFLDGGAEELAYIMKKIKSHSVTIATSDYTPEELAELYDMQQVEMHELKVKHDERIAGLNDQVSDLTEALYQERDANKVQGFNESHSGLNGDFEVALIELQEDNSYLTLENQEQRVEIEQLMDVVDRESSTQVSESSKPTLKTLANQFKIYMTQHTDDPVLNFLRRSPYSGANAGELRKHFDDECDARLLSSKERQAVIYNERGEKLIAEHQIKQRDLKSKIKDDIFQLHRMGIKDSCSIAPTPWQLGKERLVYIRWGNRTTTPMCYKRMNYYQWWMDNLTPEQAHDRALLCSKTAKVIKSVLKVYRSVSKVMNYELSPTIRSEAVDERKAKAKARRLSIKKQQVKASKIKRQREMELEKDEELQTIREAMRVAH